MKEDLGEKRRSVDRGELAAATRASTQQISFQFITINHSIL